MVIASKIPLAELGVNSILYVVVSLFSGTSNFETTSEAGADIIDAATKCVGEIPNEIYAANRDPVTVAKPDVIVLNTSDFVNLSKNDDIVR